MKKPVKKAKKPSGWEKTKALGRKGIMVSVSEEEHNLLAHAAAKDNRKIAQYVRIQALIAANLDTMYTPETHTELDRTPPTKKKGK